MRAYFLAATSALLLASAAYAQPANPNGHTPAVNTPNSPPNPGAPVAGARDRPSLVSSPRAIDSVA
jgi:hypothetical protein